MTLVRHPRRVAESGTDPGFPDLKARVIARTGHQYYADKDDLLYDRLVRRWRTLGLADAGAYLRALESEDGAAEWDALEAEITIGETFFFRYAEQFAALRDVILPGLIAARAGTRRLRIWSAGCSTGAEAYSLAILVHGLLGPELSRWDVTILGTDLSAAAIQTARCAEFGRWALRTMPPDERARWFRAIPPSPGAMRDGGYRLRPEYKAMVRFEQHNLMTLLERERPGAAAAAFDLVLCRNVLIYFSAETVLGLMRGFAERLAGDGWLLIGHAEPNPAFARWLTPVTLPGTVAYRPGPSVTPTLTPPEAAAVAPSAPAPDGILAPHAPAPPLDREPAPAARDPAPIDVRIDTFGADEARDVGVDDDTLVRIRALADGGRTAEAWREIGAALEQAPTDARLRFYQGLPALGLGREAEGERALRGAIFLERDFVMAHYQLGLLLHARGRTVAGRRALDNALKLAQALPPDAELPEGDGVMAVELVERIRQRVEGTA